MSQQRSFSRPPLRRLPNGLEVAQVDPGEAAFLYREIFVERSYLRDGFPSAEPEVIFDIGANIGLATIFFKQCFPRASIVSVEPGPDPFRALEENISRHVPGGIAYNAAVAERDGTRRFGYYPKATAESGLYADQHGETELAKRLLMERGLAERDAASLSSARHRLTHIECRTVTLSTLIREQGADRVGLLKIDVEKGELDVLAGIRPEDWPKIENVVLEVHDIKGRLERVLSLLRGHGFSFTTIQENALSGTDMHMIYATRPV